MDFARVRLVLAASAASLAFSYGAAIAASAENGKMAFLKHGCWQCHGFEGQGSTASSGGRVIADTKLPLDAFKSYVRDPTGAMPPFHEQILSDSDLADIYSYVESRPMPEPPNDIPLLRDLSSQ